MDIKETTIKKAKQLLQLVTWRDLFDSVTLFLVFFFIIRTLTAEAFVIPTGSMAPSLMGNHSVLRSPYSGYEFEVGFGSGNVVPNNAIDPMTNRKFLVDQNNEQSGDRIIVLKYMAPFHTPKRWDVCVFKAPHQPENNYIKRLIGMPGEQLMIAQGNVYTRPLDSEDENAWAIERKPLRIQQHLWFPVFHSQYQSIDPMFWNTDPVTKPYFHDEWQNPWQVSNTGNWDIQDKRIFNFKGNEAGNIFFRFHGSGSLSGVDYCYYDPSDGIMRPNLPPFEIVEDLRISTIVTPQAEGLSFAQELKVTDATLKVQISGAGYALEIKDAQGKTIATDKGETKFLKVGMPTRVELWHADQSLRLLINGEQVGKLLTYNVPMLLRKSRYNGIHLQNIEQPKVSLQLEGAAARIESLNLDRDQHYTQNRSTNSNDDHDLHDDKKLSAAGVIYQPARIPKGYYFALGDNSPNSSDSRIWGRPHPQVRFWHHHLTGEDIPNGTIPERMMIGRGIFVYFPATLPPRVPSAVPVIGNWGIVPDIKKTRYIH